MMTCSSLTNRMMPVSVSFCTILTKLMARILNCAVNLDKGFLWLIFFFHHDPRRVQSFVKLVMILFFNNFTCFVLLFVLTFFLQPYSFILHDILFLSWLEFCFMDIRFKIKQLSFTWLDLAAIYTSTEKLLFLTPRCCTGLCVSKHL